MRLLFWQTFFGDRERERSREVIESFDLAFLATAKRETTGTKLPHDRWPGSGQFKKPTLRG
jgi:hypothetical protein